MTRPHAPLKAGGVGDTPRMSVVIPCYGEGSLLAETIESALCQTNVDVPFEVIVVPDRGHDAETAAVVERYADHGVVRIKPNGRRQGSSGARNTGILAARGEWVAFLDGDDVWEPFAMEERLRAIERFPGAGWLGSDFRLLREDGSIDESTWYLTRRHAPERYREAFESGEATLHERPVAEFLLGDPPWTSTVVVRRDALRALGGFDESLTQAQDTNLWMRLAARWDFVFIPRPLACYRIRAQSISRQPGPPGYWAFQAIHALLDDEALKPYRPLLRARLGRAVEADLWHYRAQGQYRDAVAKALQAIRYAPLSGRSWRTLVGTVLSPARPAATPPKSDG